MRLLESRKGLSCFAFEHSEEYQQTQHKFLAAVESMEPNNIVVREPHRRTGPGNPAPGPCSWGSRLLQCGAWAGGGLRWRHLGTES